ncbi:hypothetical protein GXW82_09885 [Streptacidiphilus sp. 4-A2]|nr:hypothetical protein [Streptacidiphilus sp. 4-A2]
MLAGHGHGGGLLRLVELVRLEVQHERRDSSTAPSACRPQDSMSSRSPGLVGEMRDMDVGEFLASRK